MPHKKHQGKGKEKKVEGSRARLSQSSLASSSGVSSNDTPRFSQRTILLDDLLERLTKMTMIVDPLAKNIPLKKKSTRSGLGVAPIVDVQIDIDEIHELCEMAIESFAQQTSMLDITAEALPITVCADLHGQFRDLLGIIGTCGSPQDHSYVFLGDYVDRGVQGIETMALLLCLKVKYPERVFLLRGNHEDFHTSQIYGFYDECIDRFGSLDQGEKVWFFFVNVFNVMPVAALIEKRILCVHGGISPSLHGLKDIQSIRRPTVVPPCGLVCDLLWSDPDDRRAGWSLSPRGIALTFSESILKRFCESQGIDLVVRGHQISSEMFRTGYKFFASCRLVSIFSAPNYLNMKNNSSVLHVSKELHCRFTVFRPTMPKNKGQSKAKTCESPHH